MTSPLDGKLEELLEEYQRTRTELGSLQERLASMSSTVTSQRGLVTVTVGAQGEITSLRFNSRDYRQMAPKELADVVMDTINRARVDAAAEMKKAMAPFMSGNMNFDDLVEGKVDWASILPEDPMEGTGDMMRFLNRDLDRPASNSDGK